jgi:hypothetical protein
VDYQHAVIEYCEQEDCLILQDLNTAQGTYVNDVRVQNAAVRLAPGDRIRFGYNGAPYELQVEQATNVSYAVLYFLLFIIVLYLLFILNFGTFTNVRGRPNWTSQIPCCVTIHKKCIMHRFD